MCVGPVCCRFGREAGCLAAPREIRQVRVTTGRSGGCGRCPSRRRHRYGPAPRQRHGAGARHRLGFGPLCPFDGPDARRERPRVAEGRDAVRLPAVQQERSRWGGRRDGWRRGRGRGYGRGRGRRRRRGRGRGPAPVEDWRAAEIDVTVGVEDAARRYGPSLDSPAPLLLLLPSQVFRSTGPKQEPRVRLDPSHRASHGKEGDIPPVRTENQTSSVHPEPPTSRIVAR
jgi:hypothetical protein